MNESEFDRFADEYRAMHSANIRLSGESPEYFAEYKVRDVARYCERICKAPATILDFGCGVGNSIPWFRRYFPAAKVTGADASLRSLALAKSRFPDQAQLIAIRSSGMELAPQEFDLIFSACVFHHIPHDEHEHWFMELRRVARPGAVLAVFEHNPLNPLTRHAVNACPFDENARLIRASRLKACISNSGWRDASREYRIFFPSALARLRPIERKMLWLPLGAQYAVFARA